MITISIAEAPHFLDRPTHLPASRGGSHADACVPLCHHPPPPCASNALAGQGGGSPGGGAARTGRPPLHDGDMLQGVPVGWHVGGHRPDHAGTPATPDSLPPQRRITWPARTLKPFPIQLREAHWFAGCHTATGPNQGWVPPRPPRTCPQVPPRLQIRNNSSPGVRSELFFMKFPKGRKIHFTSLYFFLLI